MVAPLSNEAERLKKQYHRIQHLYICAEKRMHAKDDLIRRARMMHEIHANSAKIMKYNKPHDGIKDLIDHINENLGTMNFNIPKIKYAAIGIFKNTNKSTTKTESIIRVEKSMNSKKQHHTSKSPKSSKTQKQHS